MRRYQKDSRYEIVENIVIHLLDSPKYIMRRAINLCRTQHGPAALYQLNWNKKGNKLLLGSYRELAGSLAQHEKRREARQRKDLVTVSLWTAEFALRPHLHINIYIAIGWQTSTAVYISANRELGSRWRSFAASLNSPRHYSRGLLVIWKKWSSLPRIWSRARPLELISFNKQRRIAVVVIVSSSGRTELSMMNKTTTNLGLLENRRCRYRNISRTKSIQAHVNESSLLGILSAYYTICIFRKSILWYFWWKNSGLQRGKLDITSLTIGSIEKCHGATVMRLSSFEILSME